MEPLFFWLFVSAITGFVITTFAATAHQILNDLLYHELEEYCLQIRKADSFSKIVTHREQLSLGALTLQMIASSVAICTMVGYLIRDRNIRQLDLYSSASILILVTFALILSSSWIPWAVKKIAATPFIFRTWRWWWLVSLMVWPLLVIGRMVSAFFVRASGQEKDEDEEEEAFEDEVLSLVTEGEHDGYIEADARDMIEGVMELDDYDVAKVMTPRSRINALDVETEWEEMVEFVVESGRTRIPVYQDKIDQIVGILYAKDILRESLRSESKRRPLNKMLREPMFVPETTLQDEMLNQFLQRHVHMAIVQDEYGGVAGVITIEDVLEEIVGEIVDETDDERHDEIEIIDSTTAVVAGTAHVNRLNEEFGLTLPEDEDFDTVSGLLMRHLNEIPREGREIFIGNVRFKIEDASRRFVDSVRVEVLVDEDDEPEGSREGLSLIHI